MQISVTESVYIVSVSVCNRVYSVLTDQLDGNHVWISAVQFLDFNGLMLLTAHAERFSVSRMQVRCSGSVKGAGEDSN